MKYRVAGAICDTDDRVDGFREIVRADDCTLICDCGATVDSAGVFDPQSVRTSVERWKREHRAHLTAEVEK